MTWNYNAFKIRKEMERYVNPDYLYAFFTRSEFDRNVRFNSWGSSQELLSWDNLCSICVPVPDIEIQNSVAEISKSYILRKEVINRINKLIQEVCPVLIRGSIDEALQED